MPLAMFLWIAAVTAAFVALLFITPPVPRRREMLLVAMVAALVRIVPILLQPEQEGLFVFDIQNYEQTAIEVLHGRDIYALGGFKHPYLPFQMYAFAACKLVADGLNVPFFAVVRLPTVVADVGTSMLLVAHARRHLDRSAAVRIGLLYAACPFAVLVGFYHGQFDAISIFFAVGALYLLDQRPGPARGVWSAVLLAFGVLDKIWPVLLAPVLLARVGHHRGRVTYAAISAATVMAFILSYVLLYGTSITLMREQIVDYQPPYPLGGGLLLMIDRVFGFLPWSEDWLRFELRHGDLVALAVVAITNAYLVVRRERMTTAAVCVLAVLFVLNNDPSGYHYLWIVPIGLMAGHRGFVAAIVLLGTGLYVGLVFLNGAVYVPAFSGPGTNWAREHLWYFSAASWITFALWALAILLRPTPEEAAESPAQAATASLS